jgi:hypothetical protein
VNPLGVVIEQPRREPQRIARADFALVRDVRLETECRHASRPAMRLVEADEAEELVGREVEDHQVIAHVHVAVVIDPLRADDVTVAIERRLDVGGNVGHRRHTTTGRLALKRVRRIER